MGVQTYLKRKNFEKINASLVTQFLPALKAQNHVQHTDFQNTRPIRCLHWLVLLQLLEKIKGASSRTTQGVAIAGKAARNHGSFGRLPRT